jgi:hypothetical protein
MTRWHEPPCESPEVEVRSNNIPRCMTCGRPCPPVEVLIEERADSSSGPTISPDEPLGQMNLRWPKPSRTKEGENELMIHGATQPTTTHFQIRLQILLCHTFTKRFCSRTIFDWLASLLYLRRAHRSTSLLKSFPTTTTPNTNALLTRGVEKRETAPRAYRYISDHIGTYC